MSLRTISLVFLGTLGACTLATACTYEYPRAFGDGGGDGTGGATNSGGSGGAPGVGGSAGTAGTGGSGGMPADWWNSAWKYRVRITFQNADGNSLNAFPVMVRLDGTRIQDTAASPIGADLRFIDADGQTILPHEIDRWMPGSDSFVWVRVPTIAATDTDYIWLYYGNPVAPDVQNPGALWKSFISVYHMSSNLSAPLELPDSAGTKTAAWGNSQLGDFGAGPINEAIKLDGNHFIHVGTNNNVAANPNEARTVEAWINAEQAKDQYVAYEEGECVGWLLGMKASGDYWGNFITDSNTPLCDSGITEYSIQTTATTGSWHYVTLVVDRPGSEMRLFVDGNLEVATPINNTDIGDGNGVFRIGSDWEGLGTFVGSIDEVRVSNAVRNPVWIKAQYKSMMDQFLSFTAE